MHTLGSQRKVESKKRSEHQKLNCVPVVAVSWTLPSLRLPSAFLHHRFGSSRSGVGGGRTDFLKVLKVPGPAPAEDEALRVREDAAVGDDVGGDGVGLQCLQEEEGEVREERRLQRHRGQLAGDLNRLGSGAQPIFRKY